MRTQTKQTNEREKRSKENQEKKESQYHHEKPPEQANTDPQRGIDW